MTATNKPMTGAQLDELMAVAMRMQSDSEKMGERSVSMFAYAVQVAVLEIRETRCKYEELQSQNADLAVQLANAESKCREMAAENAHARERHVFIRALAVSILEHSGGRMDWRGAMEDATELLQTVDSVYAKTPATDAFLAEVRASGVEMYADTLDRGADDAERDGFEDGMKFLRSEAEGVRKFAAQIRKGAAL
ncbi:TPA: hypothetical protein JD321_000820 [Citrobacter freundii]|uniref:hypothetical protein n=1 Tax=Citrobacter freundii TaxID=546 RepID=UPI001B82C60F|nr:hypothetical protein [Citrobacter freundii]HDQ2773871.1 hypothetical protein [Citrobacter freundii]